MRIFSNLFIAYMHIAYNRKDANGDNDYVDDNDVWWPRCIGRPSWRPKVIQSLPCKCLYLHWSIWSQNKNLKAKGRHKKDGYFLRVDTPSPPLVVKEINLESDSTFRVAQCRWQCLICCEDVPTSSLILPEHTKGFSVQECCCSFPCIQFRVIFPPCNHFQFQEQQ